MTTVNVEHDLAKEAGDGITKRSAIDLYDVRVEEEEERNEAEYDEIEKAKKRQSDEYCQKRNAPPRLLT